MLAAVDMGSAQPSRSEELPDLPDWYICRSCFRQNGQLVEMR